jgi:uncharacterized protein YggE
MKTLCLALLSFFAVTSAAAAQTIEPAQVIVIGEGIVKATPNQAWITIGAESRSKISKDAQQRNAEAMTAVQQKLASLGIQKDAIKTTAVDLQLEFDYANGRQTPRGYVARNAIEVRVDELPKLGEVLDAVVNSGATMIHGLRFDVKERSQLETGALQSAVKDAMAKAQAIAGGAGRGIDRVMKIEEVSAVEPRPMMREFAMARADAAQTPVAPGELEIRAQVRLTVSIK